MNFVFIKRLLPIASWRRRPSSDHLRLGRRSERAAARYLKQRRWRILARNYRCAAGEIDLIAADGGSIVFVEVKTQTREDVRGGAVPVHPTQQDRIGRAARIFLAASGLDDRSCRFDVIVVSWPARGGPRMQHVEDAFHPRGT